MKKRIGIITLYHNNANYGGLLQAYALTSFLNRRGYDAKQIKFDNTKDKSPFLGSKKERLLENPVGYLTSVIGPRWTKVKEKFIKNSNYERILPDLNKRRMAFYQFEEMIPHTDEVDCHSIVKLCAQFDVFICGSDQIWNPEFARNAYFLDFVDNTKAKIAYAASVGKNTLNDKEVRVLKSKLQSFDAISIRENSMCNILRQQCGIETDWVLDPTLLLSANEWDAIAEPSGIPDDYIFTYFLGDDTKQRDAVKEFANRKGCKIVTIPHIHNRYSVADSDFADINLYDVTPALFVGLIKGAKYIITDSFHASVFSIIYRKQFVVLERNLMRSKQRMNSRIMSLLTIFNIENRMVEIDAIDIVEAKYSCNLELFYKMKNQSEIFLESAIRAQK